MARHQDETIKNNDPELLDKLQKKLDLYLKNYRVLIKERKIASVIGGLSVLDVDLKIKKCKNIVNKTRRRIREIGMTPVVSTKKPKEHLSKADASQKQKVDRAVSSLMVFWNFGVED